MNTRPSLDAMLPNLRLAARVEKITLSPAVQALLLKRVSKQG